MSSINPFSGYVAQGTQVERSQAGEKSRLIRRAQELAKNVALRDDQLEHQVESSDAISQAQDGQQGRQQQKRREDGREQEPQPQPQSSLDIRA